MNILNVNTITSCYGCGICASTCPKNAITITSSKEGFYIPEINENFCVSCGLCVKLCPKLTPIETTPDRDRITGCAAWLKDTEMLRRCSSGGAVMALAQVVVEAGYKLCGVRYNPEACRAEHFVADTLEAFMPAVGSKYIQSLTMPAFGQIIKGSDRWMVVGTPCQIAALRRYLLRTRQEERFLLVDFWCHGVPSDRLWKAFLRTVSLTPEQDGIVVSWREKTWGWQDGYVLCVRQGNRVVHHKSASQGDTYLRHFLRCTAQNQTCYGCPFRGISSAADIRVGDFWGTRFKNNRTGVSKVIALSERGRQWWTRAQQYCHIEPLTDEELSQSVVQYDIPVAWGRSTFIRLLPLPGGFRLAHAWSLIGCVLARIQKLIKRGK